MVSYMNKNKSDFSNTDFCYQLSAGLVSIVERTAPISTKGKHIMGRQVILISYVQDRHVFGISYVQDRHVFGIRTVNVDTSLEYVLYKVTCHWNQLSTW